MTHILILEVALTGHHSIYLERIAGAFLDMGSRVTVTVIKRDETHPCLIRLAQKHPKMFEIQFIEDADYSLAAKARGDAGREFAFWKIFRKSYRQAASRQKVDHVFLPYLDYCLYAIGVIGSPFGSVRWSGICMRPSFHYQKMGVRAPVPTLSYLKRRLFERVLSQSRLTSLFSIDELLVDYINSKKLRSSDRMVYLADPAQLKGIHTRASARSVLRIPGNAQVLLCYGSIDSRKGVDVAISAAASDCMRTHLLIVGKHSKEIRNVFTSSNALHLLKESRLHVIDRYVDDVEEQLAFAASDAVWLGYRSHYTMSGVLVMAGLAGKPVVATQDGLIGWYAQKYKMGVVINLDDSSSVANAMCEIAFHPAPDPKIFNGHSWQYFIKCVTGAAREQ